MAQRLLVVCAVEAETEAVRAGLDGLDGVEVDVRTASVGPAAVAAVTGAALARGSYDAVLSIGIAGAFVGGGAEVLSVVVADKIIYADLGVETDQGFEAIGTLGFGEADERMTPPATTVAELLRRSRDAGLATVAGPILTLTTFTGTDARARQLIDRHAAVAEAMEGAGIATAAVFAGIPAFEVRTISNLVGSRERHVWDLPGSLQAITDASRAMLSRPLPL